jgi:hypothetical protein
MHDSNSRNDTANDHRITTTTSRLAACLSSA